jgi:hypothetical protein
MLRQAQPRIIGLYTVLQKLLHDQCTAWVGIEAGSCLLLLL